MTEEDVRKIYPIGSTIKNTFKDGTFIKGKVTNIETNYYGNFFVWYNITEIDSSCSSKLFKFGELVYTSSENFDLMTLDKPKIDYMAITAEIAGGTHYGN